jgi:hypothetical protein
MIYTVGVALVCDVRRSIGRSRDRLISTSDCIVGRHMMLTLRNGWMERFSTLFVREGSFHFCAMSMIRTDVNEAVQLACKVFILHGRGGRQWQPFRGQPAIETAPEARLDHQNVRSEDREAMTSTARGVGSGTRRRRSQHTPGGVV